MISLATEAKKASFVTTNAVFIARSIRLSLRNPEDLIMAIMLPIILMLLFTFVFGGALDAGGGYVNYVVPGIVFICAGFGSANTAVGIAQDMTNGIIDRFRTMPIKSASVITGHVVASVVRNLVATALVFGVALLVGFDPSAGLSGWLGAVGLISLFIFTFTCLFAAIGLVASTPSAANGYGFILLFLPYVSSAFVPTNTMPSWLQGFAQHQPITPLIESIRGLLMNAPVHNNVWLSLGWCALILLVSFVWIAWAFRRKAGRR